MRHRPRVADAKGCQRSEYRQPGDHRERRTKASNECSRAAEASEGREDGGRDGDAKGAAETLEGAVDARGLPHILAFDRTRRWRLPAMRTTQSWQPARASR